MGPAGQGRAGAWDDGQQQRASVPAAAQPGPREAPRPGRLSTRDARSDARFTGPSPATPMRFRRSRSKAPWTRRGEGVSTAEGPPPGAGSRKGARPGGTEPEAEPRLGAGKGTSGRSGLRQPRAPPSDPEPAGGACSPLWLVAMEPSSGGAPHFSGLRPGEPKAGLGPLAVCATGP